MSLTVLDFIAQNSYIKLRAGVLDRIEGNDETIWDGSQPRQNLVTHRDLLISTIAQLILFTLPYAFDLFYFTRKTAFVNVPIKKALLGGIILGNLLQVAMKIMAFIQKKPLTGIGLIKDWKDYCEQLAPFTSDYRKKKIIQSLKIIFLSQAAFFLIFRFYPKVAMTFTIGSYGIGIGETITQVAINNLLFLVSSLQKKI